jgi:hypothetical protein
VVERIPDAASGVTIFFSARPFPGSQHEFQWRREESGANWYYSPDYDLEGWLCPPCSTTLRERPSVSTSRSKRRAHKKRRPPALQQAADVQTLRSSADLTHIPVVVIQLL